jgi:hypothetical protein
MEQKILSLEQGKRRDQPSPQGDRSIEARTSSSPQIQGDRQSEATTLGPTGTPDQDDVVDGMGAVALKDGAAEEEYFGKNSLPSIANLHFPVLSLTLCRGYDGKDPPPTWHSCDLSSVALVSR